MHTLKKQINDIATILKLQDTDAIGKISFDLFKRYINNLKDLTATVTSNPKNIILAFYKL